MRLFLTLLSVTLALAGMSCGGNAQPPGQANSALTGTSDPIVGGTRLRSPLSNPAPRSRDVARLEGDAPPVDARFTISCTMFRGHDHVIRADRFKEELIAKSGLHTWHILHTEQQSMLYFGYYRTYNDREHDPKECPPAQMMSS